MDTKGILEKVVVSVVTAFVLGAGAWFLGVFEKGSQAADRELIQAVVNEMLITESGTTVKGRIAEVNSELDVLEARAGRMEKDIDDAEKAILCLAGGC